MRAKTCSSWLADLATSEVQGSADTRGRCVTGLQIEPAATGRRFRAFTAKHLDALGQRAGLNASERLAIRAVGMVLPFRTNSYVMDNLIDWEAAPDDPIFRLV